MRQIDYKSEKDSLYGIRYLKTQCPYKKTIAGFDIMVGNARCVECICYIGELKNKNSILCKGDEWIEKKITYKTLLTETVIIT
jgi:hypothetical protein